MVMVVIVLCRRARSFSSVIFLESFHSKRSADKRIGVRGFLIS
ncbi:hypothetical protein EVA_17121 [gut metagenome]|uniref:Uncharacterized protein n=1 Tax=gut metagenome TaxID=749906 RepID=J9FIN7_9ZZZZ